MKLRSLPGLRLFHVVSTSKKNLAVGDTNPGFILCRFGQEMPLIACSGDTGGVLGKTSHLGRELKLRAIGALDVLDVGSVGKCRLEKMGLSENRQNP